MTVGAKLRVYEIAREVGIPNKELIAKIRALGLEVNNHMSSLDAEDAARVKRSLQKETVVDQTVSKRLSSTVIRRRSKKKKEGEADAAPANGASAEAAATGAVVRRRRPAKVEEPAPTPAEPPAPAVEARPAPTPEPAPAPEPAPEVVAKAPVEAPAEAPAAAASPAAPAAPVAEPEPEPAAPAVAESAPAADPETPVRRRRAVVDIPVAPGLGGKKSDRPALLEPEPKKAPVEAPAPAAPEAAAEVEAKGEPDADAGDSGEPDITVNPDGSPRTQFEIELERARARAAAREKEREAARKKKLEPQTPRDPSRPAPGTVISLPQSRIKIAEKPAPQRSSRRIEKRVQPRRGGGRRDGGWGKKRLPPNKKGKQTQITTAAAHKRIIKIEDTVTVQDLAQRMGVKSNEVLRKLWGMGMMGVNINAAIDFDTANIVASEFDYEVQNVAFQEDVALTSQEDSADDLEFRAPVVTVMGHVDHGKTTLLDTIRQSRVAAGEAGGITQHIAAYRITAPSIGEVVFLDTPGHEAFTEMRARGAKTTDIVILVVAADDGAMPQTVEALNHAKDAGVTIIVAVNKIDAPGAEPERIRQQLADHGLIPEEWGGDTQYMDVSALKNEGVDELLDAVALQAEILELRANPDKPAAGAIVEARLDRARGPVATALVQEGTLRVGDIVVAGEYMGKVRAMLDDQGKPVDEAGPSTPVELLGIDGVPAAGETFQVTDEKTAKQVVEHRQQQKRKKELAQTGAVSLENLMERVKQGETKELKVVLKADVQGSAEALKEALLKQSTDKVGVNVIQAGVGGITETDVNLAKAGNAIIVGFHVRPAGKAAKLAEREGVEINIYNIIYDALEDVKAAMAGLLPPVEKQVETGVCEVREIFDISKVGRIAGCMVTSGKILRKSLLRVIRDSVQIHEGKVGTLRRFKDDVNEVKEGYECGVRVDGFNDLEIGDLIESYEIVEEAATLD